MAKKEYMVEFITNHGASRLEGKDTIAATRKQACRLIGKSNAEVNVFEIRRNPYQQILVARIWYDADPGYAGYSSGNPGYWMQSYTGKKRRQRLSPKTGEPLDVSKYTRYY